MPDFDIVIRAPGLGETGGGVDQLEGKLAKAKDTAAEVSTSITGVAVSARDAGGALGRVGTAGATSMDKARASATAMTSAVGDAAAATKTAAQAYADFQRIVGKKVEDFLPGDSSIGAVKARRLAKDAAAEAKSTQTDWKPPAGLTDAIAREADVLNRIKAPMREYMADMEALDLLMDKGRISTVEYTNEFDRLNKKYGTMHGPVQGVVAQQQQQQPEKPGLSLAGAGNAVTSFLAGGATVAAVLGAGKALEGIVLQGRQIEAVYIRLSNTAMRFADASHSVTDVLHEQGAAADRLHTTMREAFTVYNAAADATRDLKLSHGDLIQIETALGQAAQLANRPIGTAVEVTRQLAVAMADGQLRGDELKDIMAKLPAVADVLTERFGVTRKELVNMANQGRIAAGEVIEAVKQGGDKINTEFQKREQTEDQLRERWVERWQVAHEEAARSNKTMFERMSEQSEAWSGESKERARAYFTEFAEGAKNLTGQFSAVRIAIEKQFNEQLQNRIATFGESGNLAGEGQGLLDSLAKQGIRTSNSFQLAKGSAQQFNNELDRMLAARGAQKISEDVKRIYDSLQGSNDLIDGQAKHWKDITDKVNVLQGAITKMNLAIPAGMNGPQAAQAIREWTRNIRDAVTEQKNAPYGAFAVSNIQSKAQAGDQLEDLKRLRGATDALVPSAEAARSKYRELVTQRNDGRLPDDIRILDKFTDPLREYAFSIGGLSSLWKEGSLSGVQFNKQLIEISDAMHDARGAVDGVSDAYERYQVERAAAAGNLGPRKIGGVDVLLGIDPHRQSDRDRAYEHRFDTDPELNVSENANKSADTTAAAIQAAADNLRAEHTDFDQSTAQQQYNQLLEREREVTNSLTGPMVEYEHRIEAIDKARADSVLTERQAQVLTRQATDTYHAANEALDDTGQALNAIIGPAKAYREQLEALAVLRERGPGDRGITQQQYLRAVDEARVAFLSASEEGRTFGGAMEAMWLRNKLAAESFGQTLAGTLMQDLDTLNGEAVKFQDALVKAAADGSVSWSEMGKNFAGVIEGMLLDLEKLLLKQLEVAAISAIIGAATGGGAGAAAGQLALSAFPGFATGGEMRVGGAGGTDSQLVQFRATPGEHVMIQTPGQYNHGGSTQAASAAPAPAPAAPAQVKVVNVIDSSTVHAAMDSPAGEQVILNVMRRNSTAIRPTTPRKG